MGLNRKRSDKRLLYAFIVVLLFSVFLNIDVFSVTMRSSQIVRASSTLSMANPGLAANVSFVIDEWRREISVDALGGISASDYCLIFNNQSRERSQITFLLPANASDISVQDAYGDISKDAIITSTREEYTAVYVNLKETLKPGERNEYLVAYRLPSSKYLIKRGWQDYTLKLSLNKPEEWFVRKFSLIISLPEGAEIRSFSEAQYKVERQGLSIKIIFTKHDLVEFDTSYITLEYSYLILWAAFRPIIWTAAAGLIGAALFFVRRFLRPPTVVTPVSPSVLKKFVEVYEEKRRLSLELESLQRQFRSGRLSRRRLRLRRRSLDQRLAAINKRLTELKDQIVTTARRYEEMLKDLETAEAEIETLNVDIERVEARFRRREISAEVRRKLLDEYNRIKERAERTISEILLRLQEESM